MVVAAAVVGVCGRGGGAAAAGLGKERGVMVVVVVVTDVSWRWGGGGRCWYGGSCCCGCCCCCCSLLLLLLLWSLSLLLSLLSVLFTSYRFCVSFVLLLRRGAGQVRYYCEALDWSNEDVCSMLTTFPNFLSIKMENDVIEVIAYLR